MMKLSIVLLTWNASQFIPNCLDSLLAQTPDETEIIIIDNGSVDSSKQLIQQKYPQAILIANQQNRGVGPARNQGLLVAKGEFILVLDIDTVVQPEAIPALIRGMENYKQVGLSGARLISPDGQLQYTCRHFPTVWSKLLRQLPAHFQDRLLRREELRDWDHATPRLVGYVIGACQMIRREAMQEVGLYDEEIFYGPEDVDYCLRMWQAGWQVLYNPEAIILHLERRITRSHPWRNPLFWIHLKGLIRYFWRHKYFFRAPRFEELARRPG